MLLYTRQFRYPQRRFDRKTERNTKKSVNAFALNIFKLSNIKGVKELMVTPYPC